MFISTPFSQSLKFFPEGVFRKSVAQYGGDRYAKRFSCRQQLVAMLFAQFSEARSLRDLEIGYHAHPQAHYHLRTPAIHRSTLADANAKRDWRIFLAPALTLMSQMHRRLRHELDDMIRIIDSSPIPLHKACHDWAEPTRIPRYQGLKLHLEYAPEHHSPTQMAITPANVNDLTQAKEWEQEAGVTYVLDKGYCDYNWWWQMHQKGAFFVTRLKRNAAITVEQEQAVHAKAIQQDSTIRLTNRTPRGGKQNHYSVPLRRVVVERPDHNSPLILVTNRFDLSAERIAELYKERWQIELMFKWLKQNLKLKSFLGHSENAIKIQIITALIAYMLVALMKKASNSSRSLKHFLITFKQTLLTTPKPLKPPENIPNQHTLNFTGQ